MEGPWELFQSQEDGPWKLFQTQGIPQDAELSAAMARSEEDRANRASVAQRAGLRAPSMNVRLNDGTVIRAPMGDDARRDFVASAQQARREQLDRQAERLRQVAESIDSPRRMADPAFQLMSKLYGMGGTVLREGGELGDALIGAKGGKTAAGAWGNLANTVLGATVAGQLAGMGADERLREGNLANAERGGGTRLFRTIGDTVAMPFDALSGVFEDATTAAAKFERAQNQWGVRRDAHGSPVGSVLNPANWTLGDSPTLLGQVNNFSGAMGSTLPSMAEFALATPLRAATAGAVMGATGNSEQAKQEIDAAWQNGTLQGTDAFHRLVAQGHDPEDVYHALRDSAGQGAAINSFIPAGAGGFITQKVFGPIEGAALRTGAGRTLTTAGRVGLGALGEPAEEGFEQFSANVGADRATGLPGDPQRGVAENIIGALPFGVMGAGRAAHHAAGGNVAEAFHVLGDPNLPAQQRAEAALYLALDGHQVNPDDVRVTPTAAPKSAPAITPPNAPNAAPRRELGAPAPNDVDDRRARAEAGLSNAASILSLPPTLGDPVSGAAQAIVPPSTPNSAPRANVVIRPDAVTPASEIGGGPAPVLDTAVLDAALGDIAPPVAPPSASPVIDFAALAQAIGLPSESAASPGALPPSVPEAEPQNLSAPSDTIMQNRDRKRAASVAQMQDIRRNPDAERLGFSRDPNTGAPMVGEGAQIPDVDKGRADFVKEPDGTKTPVRYAVVEADSLAASHDADGNTNPDYATAPLKALSNGRTAGLQAAYSSGHADAYRAGIMADAELHGVPREAIASKRKPVLVRLYDPSLNTGDMGARSNASQQLGLSPVEQAQTDARALPDLSGLEWNEDGSISPARNANFFRAWFRKLGATQAANLQDRNGHANAMALQRVRAALVQRAYDDERLLSALIEDVDSDNRNVVNALARAAPGFAKLDDTPYAKGVKAALTGGMQILRDAKARGLSIEDALAQQDMFGRNPDADSVAQYMAGNAKSAKRMAEAFAAVAEYAALAEQQAATLDVFGNSPQHTTTDALRSAGILENEHGTAAGNDARSVREGNGSREQAGRGRTATGDAGGFQLASHPATDARADTERVGQSGLFAPPTAQEHTRAARGAKDAERNGLGRDVVRPEQGDGELLAGGRPAQADVEDGPLESVADDDGFSEEGRRQFRETERAYGGREGYERDKAAGRTKLTYGQWVQVRTPAFLEWFGDWMNDPANASKVVDPETGEPMVVYHGTPNAMFVSFKDGAHFTEDADYAAVYMHPSASSINAEEKRADAAAIYPVYLAIQRPFDTRDPAIRAVFDREFFGKWGNATPLTDRGLPDWTDSRDLLEWIEETDQPFDGLILDEGGTPEGGHRGLSYVPVKSAQIKSATANNGDFSRDRRSILESRTTGDPQKSSPASQKNDPMPGNGKRTRRESIQQGSDDADAMGMREAVRAVIGDIPVTFLRGMEGLPTRLRNGLERKLAQRGGKGRTAGLFDPKSRRAYVFTDVVKSAEDAAFVAAHEVAGHKGLRALAGDKLTYWLKRAAQNPTVRKVAAEIAKQRKMNADQWTLSVEEALSELSAATRTGDWSQIVTRYKVDVSKTLQSSVRAALENFLRKLKELIGPHVNQRFSDAQVRQLLEASFKAAQREAASATVRNADGSLEQVVFHGTPHAVDRFSLQKIGTGEGAQAYGYGLYFAGQKEIAEHYRKTLSDTVVVKGAASPLEVRAAQMAVTFGDGTVDGAKAWLAKKADGAAHLTPALTPELVASVRSKFNDGTFSLGGNLYRVDVPEDSDLLDYDKPLSEQPEKVREAVAAAHIPRQSEYGGEYNAASWPGGMTGGQWYGKLASALSGGRADYNAARRGAGGGQRAASEYLQSIGIPGLRYLDGNSRSKGEGSANYVIWDENAIGQPESALESTEGQTQSEAFGRWFGDSVVTENGKAGGKPLVVYHGSPDARFMDADATFMSLKDRYGDKEGVGAFWFAADRATAASYADDLRAFDYQNAEPAVIGAYLKLENPLVVDGGGKEWREAQAIGKTTDVIEKAKAEGRDGVIIRNVRDNYNNGPRTKPTDTYVVFNSRQIKSADKNNGNFNPDNPSILESVSDDSAPAADERASMPPVGPVVDLPSRRPGESQQDYTRRISRRGGSELRAINAEMARMRKIGRANFRAMLAKQARMADVADAVFHEYRTLFDKADRAALLEGIDQWETGRTVTDPDLRNFFSLMDGLFAERIERLRAAKPDALKELVENYFPHIWEDTGKAEQWYSANTKRPLDGNKSFLKQRTWGTIREGMASGLRPVSYNPVDLALLKLGQMDKFITFHEFKNDLKARGWLKQVKAGERLPEGYALIDSPAFKGSHAFVVKGDDGGADHAGTSHWNWAVPELIAKDVNNYLSPSLYRFGAWKALRYVQNVLMSTRLGFSMFHAGFTTLDNAVTHGSIGLNRLLQGDVVGAAKEFAYIPLSPLVAPYHGGQLNKMWRGKVMADPHTQALLLALEEGGARRLQTSHQQDFNNALNSIARKLRRLRAPGLVRDTEAGVHAMLEGPKSDAARAVGNAAVKQAAELIGAVGELSSWLIHQKLVPAQKMNARVSLLKFELDRLATKLGKDRGDYKGIIEAMHPDVLRQVAGRVVDNVDDRLGQMNYDNQFWPKVAREIAQATIGAVGWQVGTVRTVTGGVRDLQRIVKPESLVATLDKEGRITDANMGRLTNRVTNLLVLGALMSAASVIAQMAMTGDPPEEPKDFFFPRTGRKNRDDSDERLQFPTYWMDHYKLATHPLQTAGHKVHPSIGMALETFANKDYYGVEIRDEDAPLPTQATQIAEYFAKGFVPYSITGQGKLTENDAGLAARVGNFFGFTVAPASVSRSEFQAFVADKAADTAPRGARTQAQADKSEHMREVESELRRGESPDMSGLTERQLRDARRAAGMQVPEIRFMRLSLEDKLRGWDMATPEERARYHLHDRIVGKDREKDIARLPEGDREYVRRRLEEISASAPDGR